MAETTSNLILSESGGGFRFMGSQHEGYSHSLYCKPLIPGVPTEVDSKDLEWLISLMKARDTLLQYPQYLLGSVSIPKIFVQL